MMRQLPSGPSRQEASEDLVMNFILDQEEKVKQIEEYMGVIGSDFMQLSLEVIGKLKEEINMEESRVKKIKKITRKVPSFDESEPQPQPLPDSPSLDVKFRRRKRPKTTHQTTYSR
ncbi:hypothetical protein Tco_0418679 [Tanacetum coccineum]